MLGREGGTAATTDQADGVAQVSSAHEVSGANVDQSQVNPSAELSRLVFPLKGEAATVTPLLVAQNSDRHLEAVVFFVGNVRLVGQIHVAHGDGFDRSRRQARRELLPAADLFNGFAGNIDLEVGGIFGL